jgi:chemotaxis response regulator CheB
MRTPLRVLALLSDSGLRHQVQKRWRDNGISLCGVHAEGGEFLVEELARLRPQVVVADTEVDGVREIIQLASARYRIPVIGVVRAQQSGLGPLRPLDWGAVTVVARNHESPEQVALDLESAIAQTREAQVVELLEADFPLSGAFPDASVFDLRRALRALRTNEKVVVVGAGLGGPMAARRVFGRLRGRPFSPIVYAQHISESLLPVLAQWLESHTGVAVRCVEPGQSLEVGHVYVASTERDAVRIEPADAGLELRVASSNGTARPLDALLCSAADSYGSCAVGVLLSGHGDDGCEGMLALRAAGGFTIAQDRASSFVYELPGHARECGGAIECLPINEIAERIQMLMHPEPVAHA